MSGVCPCCRQALPAGRSREDAERLLAEILARPTRQARILKHLVEHLGEYASRRELADLVYGDDPDGGPDDAEGVISKLVRGLRGKVAPLGFELVGRSRHGTRLVWRAPGEAA